MLVNTNFPSIFPKFESIEAEFSIAGANSGMSKAELESFFRDTAIVYGRFLEFVINVVSASPDIQFLIRSHPFEDESRYRIIFSSYRNVTVSSSGDVYDVLRRCDCLIHFDCTTAIEASLLGVPVGSIEACDIGQPRQRLPRAVSEGLRSVDETIDFISRAQQRPIEKSDRSQRASQILREYFGPLDGRADVRIATVLVGLKGRVRAQLSGIELVTALLAAVTLKLWVLCSAP